MENNQIIRNIDGKNLFLMEAIPDYVPQSTGSIMNVGITNQFFFELGLNGRFPYLLTIYRDGICELWMPKQEFDDLGEEIIRLAERDSKWMLDLLDKLRHEIKDFRLEISSLSSTDYRSLSDSDLLKVYKKFIRSYIQIHLYAWPQTVVDFGDNIFSKKLQSELEENIGKKNQRRSVGDLFSTLTTPTELGAMTLEYEDLLTIYSRIKLSKELSDLFAQQNTGEIAKEIQVADDEIDGLIDKHVENFGWIGCGMGIPNSGWGKEYFIDLLASFARQGLNQNAEKRKIEEQKSALAQKQREIEKQMELSEKQSQLFAVAREIVFTKGFRKDAMFFYYSKFIEILKEIAKRKYLSLNQIRFIYPDEMSSLLVGEFDVSRLNKRPILSLYLSVGDGDEDIFLEGEKARESIESLNLQELDLKNVDELGGDCACAGQASGVVKIINRTDDMSKMNEGDILVSVATTPELVPAIKKASAIVTDVGGITCHAAIISRELGIPCVTGTKFATKVLKDGDFVEVDANKGAVKKL